MAGVTMERFRGFLTERFTTAAVDIFAEVESMLVACYEENARLRGMLHMVLSPEIKLPRIDAGRYTGATTNARELPSPANTTPDQDMTEPLPKRPKEEPIECEISQESKPEPEEPLDTENFTQVCVKSEPEDEDVSMPYVSEPVHNADVELNNDSSATISGDEARHYVFSSSDSDGDVEERTNEKESTQVLQKTMLEIPRTMPNNSFAVAPDELRSFLANLTENFKHFDSNDRPLITTMGLTADVEMVNSAFGKVCKGSPLSYQCPVPSSHNYTAHDAPPSRPPLPLCDHILEPLSSLPVLSPEELDHVDEMLITWTEAHSLERSTCGCTEYREKLTNLRLTSRFRKICRLKPGESSARKLIAKIRKGAVSKPEERMKAVALVDYCKRLGVNWSPCGLVVHPNAPWLGAVPDGLVYDPKEAKSYGLVHVKSAGDCSFMACQDGLLRLRKGHRHYWDVQGEMLVTGASWCDLLVISSDSIVVQRIYRDDAIIETMKRKLDQFFFFHYLPSLVSSGHKTCTGLA
ncbi:uncharacterized protein LOC115388783 [Salarias fasciatus]|uniref:uncharacterized protein LOC115388783 n=1 Tax=Salarias fasciatus TaxID=181472 RepID=UPI00117700A9|nr:uncharacterized protein LOC115388783 [Salarias fasciatus]